MISEDRLRKKYFAQKMFKITISLKIYVNNRAHKEVKQFGGKKCEKKCEVNKS